MYPAVPVPSFVELLANVGAVAVFHTTPLAEIVPPPALMALPPDEAVLFVIELTAVVVTLGVATAVALAAGGRGILCPRCAQHSPDGP